MTPDQLKEYVDAALSQRDSFTILYFIAVPVLAFLSAYFGAYLKEKGKNTATKEDVTTITTKIEESKSVYAERLEKLKTDLLGRSHFSKVRYEREMEIYEDIWPKLAELKNAVLSLRPVMDAGLSEGETEEVRRTARSTRYIQADMAFSKTVEDNRPFYPEEIWNELRKLLKICWSEAVDFKFRDAGRDMEYWDKAIANADAITSHVNQICEAIRARLTKFDDA
jgi:hypothetical protein